MPIFSPQILRISLGGTSGRLFPSNQMSPLVTMPLLPRSPIAALSSVDFPEPDSPTRPRISPGWS